MHLDENMYNQVEQEFCLIKMLYINVYSGIHAVNRKISKGKKIMTVLYGSLDLPWGFVCKLESNRNKNKQRITIQNNCIAI